MLKRIAFVMVLAAAVALLVPSVALANFAIHGNYVQDTDACAGCHRAHTSISTITWTDNFDPNIQHDALLTTSATAMYEFCYACHGDGTQGADTNVQSGIYEGTLYGVQGGILNGGGFDTVDTTVTSSTHMYKGSSWGAYGGGYFGMGAVGADGQDPNANVGETVAIKMDCATCHDPHGSANYRILKSVVFGNKVGGYEQTGATTGPGSPLDPNPNGWVSSNETGWPTGGFRLHIGYPGYEPNYTTALYAKGYDVLDGSNQPIAPVVNANKGMSGWCAGCHATYNGRGGSEDSTYNAGDGGGLIKRHRHPMNVPLSNYAGPDWESMIVTTNPLPLDHDLGEGPTAANTASDWLECLTCHRAHGTAATMVGWADEYAADPSDDIADFVSRSGSGDPSALLRLDNRGVCEVCHNK
jgi:Doubled CXXCH motif (Paired_CXXCH_1)